MCNVARAHAAYVQCAMAIHTWGQPESEMRKSIRSRAVDGHPLNLFALNYFPRSGGGRRIIEQTGKTLKHFSQFNFLINWQPHWPFGPSLRLPSPLLMCVCPKARTPGHRESLCHVLVISRTRWRRSFNTSTDDPWTGMQIKSKQLSTHTFTPAERETHTLTLKRMSFFHRPHKYM